MNSTKSEIRPEALARLEGVLDYHFTNVSLLELALTHSSYANEQGRIGAHNERLEFLGDAVMELCVSTVLYHRFPDAREGDLTMLRSSLVSTTSFAQLARELGIDRLLFLGRGEDAQGGRKRDSVLSDAFEAVMAAVYEDGGFAAARKTVDRIFARHWPAHARDSRGNLDNKTHLQEITHRLFQGKSPVYALLSTTGPSHDRTFTVSVTLPDGKVFTATGNSCKRAEQDAAALAITAYGEKTDPRQH